MNENQNNYFKNPHHILIVALWILHCILSLKFSFTLPWGGDEWYTYNDYDFTGIPNNWLVMILKGMLGEVNASNYILYRQVGIFWTSFIYLYSYLIVKNDEKSIFTQFIYAFLVFFTFSQFIIFQEQMFRYYGLYLFYSFIINYFILKFNDTYKKHRLRFIGIFLISIPIHILLTWQLVFYIFWKEFSQLKPRLKIIFGTSLFIVSGIVFIKIGSIMSWLMSAMSDGKYQMNGTSMKGFSISSLMKPIISLFNYFFGLDILPTENIFVIVLFGLLLILIIWSTVHFFRKQKLMFSLDILFASIIPFLAMFFILQSITLPGATQLESKHAMFVIFWFIYMLVYSFETIQNKYLHPVYLYIPLIAILTGLVFSLKIGNENWSKVVETAKIKSGKGFALVDGRSEKTFRFYSKGIIDTNYILNNWDTAKVEDAIKKSTEMSLTLLDYKSYQILTKEQMWNTGTGSEVRNAVSSFSLKKLRENGFKATASYSHYPLMSYHFKKTNEVQPITWFYGYPYADLHLPVIINNDSILGWYPYQAGDTIYLNHSFYYLLENKGNAEPIGMMTNNLDVKSELKSTSDGNKFRSHYCLKINADDQKVFEWHKRPLLSSSLAYAGSSMNSTGFIYQYKPKPNQKLFIISNKDVKLYYGILK